MPRKIQSVIELTPREKRSEWDLWLQHPTQLELQNLAKMVVFITQFMKTFLFRKFLKTISIILEN